MGKTLRGHDGIFQEDLVNDGAIHKRRPHFRWLVKMETSGREFLSSKWKFLIAIVGGKLSQDLKV